uniref:NADH-ubiquinone oxidoreductase chain 2 n=1 Tax=Euaesthetus ruficapillus TaxID=295609 RepID=A0A0S2M7K2_9COLE|nr:NADH deshydrogenase subunit 2 [Euaesthetus ruficapillus]
MLFIMTLMIGSLISISSSSWMGMWIGLEINLLSIIPLMNNINNSYSTESSLKYFITQTIASTILLMGMIILSNNLFMENLNLYFILIINSSLLMKMGAAPFHFWLPEILEGMTWINCFIIMTWQKIAPMIMLMYNLYPMKFLIYIILISMIISSILNMNQISLRKIMAYSSINHIAWMISSMLFFSSIWLIYFLIYTITSSILILMFNKFNIFLLNQLNLYLSNYNTLKMIFMMNFFSLGGLPPFIGFLPKWLTIQILIENNLFFFTFLLMNLSLINLYVYLRITWTSLLLNSFKVNFLNMKKNFFNIWFLTLMSLISLIICTIMFNFN